jgi:hypothetical protein
MVKLGHKRPSAGAWPEPLSNRQFSEQNADFGSDSHGAVCTLLLTTAEHSPAASSLVNPRSPINISSAGT